MEKMQPNFAQFAFNLIKANWMQLISNFGWNFTGKKCIMSQALLHKDRSIYYKEVYSSLLDENHDIFT